MLSKSVCKKCCKKNWPDLFKKYSSGSKAKTWSDGDTEHWSVQKYVICPCDIGVEYPRATTYEPPPSWCLCKLEHAVAAGMKK